MAKNTSPSFLVKLAGDYSSKLRLPRVFVQKYGEFLPKKAKLKTSSGATWIVKLEERETDDGDERSYDFSEGWSAFAEDLDLETGEFLVLRFDIDESKFDVSVYATDWGEREILIVGVDSDTDEEASRFNNGRPYIPVNGKNYCKREISDMDVDSDETGRQVRLEQENGSRDGMYRSGGKVKSFSAEIKNHHIHFMDVPKAFAVETGIATKREITLQNIEGKKWHVGIPNIKGGRIRISRGWCRFYIENKLVVGSTWWFEFDVNSGNLIVKKEIDLTNTSSSKRRRATSRNSVIRPARGGRTRPSKNKMSLK